MLIRLAACSLCIIAIVILVGSHFSLEGGTVVLIAPITGHCLPFTFYPLGCIGLKYEPTTSEGFVMLTRPCNLDGDTC